MKSDNSNAVAAVDRFWDRYIDLLHKQGVKRPAEHWYVKRAEHYIRVFRDKKLASHTPQDVSQYLSELGRDGRIKDWQFAQAADAIRNLFCLVGVSWLHEVDWQYWRDFSGTLSPAHPTLAREHSGAMARLPAQAQTITPVASRPEYTHILTPLITEIRRRHYSIRTEQAYQHWVVRFVAYIGHAEPRDAGAAEVSAFLEQLAVQGNVAASTQNQALNALVFYYKEVLKQPLETLNPFVRAKRPKRLPVVLSRAEVSGLLAKMQSTSRLMAGLMYGTGMRLVECVRLRVGALCRM